MKLATTSIALLAALGATAAVGCGSSSTTENVGSARATLHRSKNCGDLIGGLRADAKAKINRSIDRQIQAIQNALNALGYQAGTPDGIMSSATAQSIRDYQSKNKLEVTGTVTPSLIEKLNAGLAPAKG